MQCTKYIWLETTWELACHIKQNFSHIFPVTHRRNTFYVMTQHTLKKKKFRQTAFTLTLYVLWFLVLFHFFLKAGHDPLNWFYKPEIGFNTKYKKVFFPFDPIPLNLIITSSIWEEGTGLLLKQRIPPWFWCLQKQNAFLNYIISTNQVFDKIKVFVFSLQNFT